EDLLEAPDDRGAGWSAPQIVDVRLQDGLDIAIERRQQHLVLAAERTVEAAFAQTHFVQQPVERRCLIAVAPEQRKRAIQHLLVVKFPQARHLLWTIWSVI